MAESSGKVVFDVDAQKAYTATQKLTKEFQQVGKQIAQSVAGITALANMIDRAADAAKRIREETAEANKARGGSALDRGAAGRTMNLTGSQLQAYQNIQEGGAVSEQDQVAFMAALAKAGGRRVRGAGGLEYAKAFATGAFSQEELLEAAKKGRKVDIGGRMGALSQAEKDEIDLRAYELEQTRRTSGGQAERLALIERARQRRDNPGLSAFVEGIEGAPIVGGMVREANMDRLADSYGEGKLGGKRASPVRVTIDNQRPMTGAKAAEPQ
jgi:hypothetical protein